MPHNDKKEKDEKKELKEISMDEVAKHNDDKDPWVVVGGQVLAVKDFLPDHPGGAKAIMLYAGRDVCPHQLPHHAVCKAHSLTFPFFLLLGKCPSGYRRVSGKLRCSGQRL